MSRVANHYSVTDQGSECAMICQKDCGSFFGYNPQLMKCRTHMKMFMSGILEEDGWIYYFLPKDCKDLHDNGYNKSGVYEIYPSCTSSGPVRAYCDMDTMDGGWTVIQKRVNGSLSFHRNWEAYKNGFGAPDQDNWIGNDVIHQLTYGKTSYLYVSITLVDGRKLFELYDQFSVSNESDKYQLHLTGNTTGTLGDSMMNTGNPSYDLSGMYFSTYDKDSDRWSLSNCAAAYEGGWWFNNCRHAFLNGPWNSKYWQYPWNPTVMRGLDVRGTMMLIKCH
ncbi:fibroleukin-like [Saccostrea echinata]|uniref:fibroleukin-like n=1 Tax=Saccostrea echinata TaxID=191078 RepID=UPI002A7EF88F|nr:fibroleukin-like [Saccostrea echinata]